MPNSVAEIKGGGHTWPGRDPKEVKAGTIILHARQDKTVPLEHSLQLIKKPNTLQGSEGKHRSRRPATGLGNPPTPLKKNLRIARSAKAEGPYRQVSGPISTSWVEGPSAIQVGEEFLIYFDHYAAPQYYGAIRSRDLVHWEDVSSKVKFPKGTRHGTVLRAPEETIAKLSSSAKMFRPGEPWLDDHGVPINAHGDYYLVEGDYTGSRKHAPKDLRIVCWYFQKTP